MVRPTLSEAILRKQTTALELCMTAFKAQPSLQDYQHIEDLAQAQWATLQPDFIHYLRGITENWRVTTAKVQIFLKEGLVQDAIAALHRSSDSALIRQVMDAALDVEPSWVKEKAQSLAEDIITAGQSKYYDVAVQWLSYLRSAYTQLQRPDAWQVYRTNLIRPHGRNRNLMTLIKQWSLQWNNRASF